MLLLLGGGRGVILQAIGQAAETELAQPLGRRHGRLLGTALEADTTPSGGLYGDGVYGEGVYGEGSFGGTFRAISVKLIGQVVETELAQPLRRVRTRGISMVTETSTAQPIGRLSSRLLGQPSTTETAQHLVAFGGLGIIVPAEATIRDVPA